MDMVKDRYIAPIFEKVLNTEPILYTKSFESYLMQPGHSYILTTKIKDESEITDSIYIDWEKECVIPF